MVPGEYSYFPEEYSNFPESDKHMHGALAPGPTPSKWLLNSKVSASLPLIMVDSCCALCKTAHEAIHVLSKAAVHKRFSCGVWLYFLEVDLSIICPTHLLHRFTVQRGGGGGGGEEPVW